MVKVEGKEGISATIIADSINESGDRMVTMELEYPRFILPEVNTHKMLSKNTASSRAIPVKSMHENILKNTAYPVYYGRNQSGMVAGESLSELGIESTRRLWDSARDIAISHSRIMSDIGNHKQVANRIVEPFMMVKTVMSGTEWANLIWLRDRYDAQPEFQVLGSCISAALKESVPKQLKPGQWHLPYVESRFENDTQTFWSNGVEIDLVTARKISASCCAQVSYRKNDDSLEKANSVFEMLNIGKTDVPPHVSPVEHQACAMWFNEPTLDTSLWPVGYSHIDRNGRYWSGNLRGWVQFRKMIPNEAKW